MEYKTIKPLVGQTFASVEHTENEDNDDILTFTSVDGRKFEFSHSQACCESVVIEDICGDLLDLVGSPLTLAEECINVSETDCESETWTFYRFGTSKGIVTVRWHGVSNGFYSESVSLFCDGEFLM